MIDNVQNVSSLSLTRGLGKIASEDGLASLGAGAAAAAMQSPAMSFASVLGGMAADAVQNVKAAESKSFDAIEGKANMREVVDSVLQAEQSLQTAIAFRDKIVNAYLDITKMQM
ncbi:flagellar hook-basal body complex protein FliE [Rhizobium sp. SSA_523]|uniref:flagellar hook-basal body complex protein FliE n=1 Tax=Rhizobium sp. SSA_523 TaxID=2952477 RepID=UPI002091B3CE|nr:flagellar hook-basal body complex protein FliE [Rhizobium sp. SSA_523]MCO5733001.1 flagellar hook-basal body complex protein FliE [Rhizobium sp. SSA_523]WKC23884.1 flagellar hook-basal body complex protein FliE [Rhizobium sp. SSA_523]